MRAEKMISRFLGENYRKWDLCHKEFILKIGMSDTRGQVDHSLPTQTARLSGKGSRIEVRPFQIEIQIDQFWDNIYKRSPHFVIFGTEWLSWNAGTVFSIKPQNRSKEFQKSPFLVSFCKILVLEDWNSII